MNAKKIAALAFALVILASLSPGKAEEGARKFLLLIDYRHNDLAGVSQSKDAALYFLGAIVRDTDEVSLMLFSDIRGLLVIEDFTTNHDQIRKRLEGMNDVPGAGDSTTDYRAWMVAQSLTARPGSTRMDTEGADDAARGELGAQEKAGVPIPGTVSRTSSIRMRDYVYLRSMKEFAEGLGDVPGRKNIIYFSVGYPAHRYDSDRIFRERFDEMAAGFEAAQAPVYTINALGRRQDLRGLSEKVGFLLRKFADITGGRYYAYVERYKEIAQDIGKSAGL